MATSETEIANMALIELGERPITSLSDQNLRARIISARFATARDEVLRSHTWGCATKRAALALLSAAPSFGYTRAFALPSDFIRLVDSDQSIETLYRMETIDGQRAILTDDATFSLRYVYRLEDVSRWDSLLASAVAAKLAAECCRALTGSTERRRDLRSSYEDKLAEARLTDQREDPPEDALRSPWAEARHDSFEEPWRRN